jgi:hypothetical protein
MSYDFAMDMDCGGPERHVVLDGLSYTYNVWPMYYDAMGGSGVNDLDGKTGHECVPLLRAAVAKMEGNPAKYRAMNPENGYGGYEGALRALRDLLGWCRKAPLAMMRIS